MNEEPQVDLNEVDKTVAKAIDKAGEAESNEIRLSSGVVLLAKQANPNMLIRAMTSHRRPDPPTYFDKGMGRQMENPDDPDYISRVQAWQMEYSNAMLNVLIGLGTELKSLPKGMEGPHPKKVVKKSIKPSGSGKFEKLPDETVEEMPQWIKDYQALGFPIVPDSPAWRYITWVMFLAAPTDQDTKLIGEKVRALSGVKEADVRDAETFPAGN